MKMHFADIWETIADAFPDNEALVHGEVRRSWRDYEDRAARLAACYGGHGLAPGAKVAVLAHNSPEHLEAHFAAYKIRAIPINVNYRYFEDELVYLFDNADAEAVVFQARFAERLAAVRGRLPKLKLFIEIADGSGLHLDGTLDFETTIAEAAPAPRIERSEDDHYMLYTGGTTGMPKGVIYRQGDFAAALMLAFGWRGLEPPENGEQLIAAIEGLHAAGGAVRSIPGCPLMHGTGMWISAIASHNMGGCVITFDNQHFDAGELWALAAAEKATDLVIVGDAFGKPMLQALEAEKAAGRAYDLDALVMLISSGVMFSREVKRRLLEHVDCNIIDAAGSTEGGIGNSVTNRETPVGETARFEPNENTKVFTDDNREVVPGSGEIGMIANGGVCPLGYYKDPEKSALTFREIDGHRYSFPGDFATVAEDGTLVLLGRGSNCINSGGEKVFPEEVEEVVKSHPSVYDCLVVGVPDERFGERVTAVASFQAGQAPGSDELIGWLHGRIAGYKLPKDIVAVAEVKRAANGKADYAWAKQTAVAEAKAEARGQVTRATSSASP